MELFLAQGFEKTLVDDIAAAAHVSRRTFFNYFPSKQDVLSEWFRDQGEHLAASFSASPRDESPWSSLEAAYVGMRGAFGRDNNRVLKLRRLFAIEPGLLAKKYECVASTMNRLTLVVEQRLPKTSDRKLRAQVLVQAAVGAYNSACADWEDAPGKRSFESVLMRAFSLAEPEVARCGRSRVTSGEGVAGNLPGGRSKRS